MIFNVKILEVVGLKKKKKERKHTKDYTFLIELV